MCHFKLSNPSNKLAILARLIKASKVPLCTVKAQYRLVVQHAQQVDRIIHLLLQLQQIR